MKMNATEITARREQIKTTRANIKTVVNIYSETSDRTPAETVAAIVERLGYDTAREAIAEIINTVGEWDGRIWPSSREWAATIETAATRDELEAKNIYQPAEIHPAHINQLAQAMSKYTPPAPQEQEADQRKPIADMMSDCRAERDTKQIATGIAASVTPGALESVADFVEAVRREEDRAAQTPADILRQAGALELTHRVALYIPGTTDTDKPADNAAQVKRVARRFCELFGGATAQQSAGYWMSERAGLVAESVTIVYAACTKAQRDAHLTQVLELAQDIKRDMAQEAVSVELDGALYII